jgi:sugar phosphate isomerase/epimerase
MKLGFSTNAFTNRTIFSTIDSLSEIGYDGIELVVDTPHAFLPLKKDYSVKIINYLKQKNLQISNLNSNTVVGWYGNEKNIEKFEPSLSNKNSKLRNWRISYTKKTIDLASELNSPSICLTSGLKNNKSNKELLLFKKSLDIVAEYAEKKNILIAIEYEPGLLIENSTDVWNLFSNDFKNIGLNLDTCHVSVLNENIYDIINKFNKKIFHTHISDCKNNIHSHLIPGLGELNFEKIVHTLKKINYCGFLTAELYPYYKKPEETASKAFIYLKNLIN